MTLLRALAPFVAKRRRVCELCGAALGEDHGHVAEIESRVLACACRSCALLFTRPGLWRTVPDRHLEDPSFSLTEAEWASLGIPVSAAFFFRSTASAGWLAVYPSAAGAVESQLPLAAFAAISARSSLVRSMESDVEALLVGEEGRRCLLVPIHTCYALIGTLRRTGRGLDAGRRAVSEAIAAIGERCERFS